MARRKIPLLKSVMTPFPYSVEVSALMVEALGLMEEHQIHHLPVVRSGALVGVISEADIVKRQAACDPAEFDQLTVGEAVGPHLVTYDLNEPLDNVVTMMARDRVDAVVVTRQGRLAGIFSTSDACRVLAGLLRDQFRPGGGDDAA